MEAAAVDLKAGAFKLWVYFAKNQNNYEFGASNVEVEKSFGMKKKQYDDAMDTLIEKGYLVEVKHLYYIFHEVPEVEKVVEPTVEEVVETIDNSFAEKNNDGFNF